MDSLADNVTPGDLKRALKSLTGDLNEVYNKSLDRMERALRPAYRQVLKRVLLWVAWAERPLSIAELGHALAIRPGIEDISEEDIFPIRNITTWSAGLLFIDSKDLVRVIHPTARRFFLERRSELYPRGDVVIAHDCLHYLGMKTIRDCLSGPNQRSLFKLRRQAYPLIDYATLYALQHVARSQETDDDYRAARFLLSDARKAFVQALYYLDPSWTIDSDTPALHVAVYLGATSVVSCLIDEGEEVDARDSFGATPLMYAASRGDRALEELERLLKAGADPSLSCDAGSTALIRAVTMEAESLISRLLQEPNININAVPTYNVQFGSPAIISAVDTKRHVILEKLLRREDIDVNIFGNDAEKGFRSTALHKAVLCHNTQAIKCLLKHRDINVDCVSPVDRYTPLLCAARLGYIDCMQILLDHGADVHFRDICEGSALMRAADTDSAEAVQWLIKYGADVKHKDFLDRTVIHSAACNKSWHTLSYLVGHVADVDVNVQGKNGETPLHDCCNNNGSEGVRILVNSGARCDIKNKQNRTALDIARLKNETDILNILQQAEGYSTVDQHITKTLKEAIAAETSESLRIRISKATPEEINTISEHSGTPLHVACKQGRADVVEMLVKAGANIETFDYFGGSPALAAIRGNRIDCIKVLIAHGLSGDGMWRPGGIGLRLWEEACALEKWEIAFLLIENGACVDDKSVYLQSALHRAASDDNVAVARRLVGAGASISREMGGYTATQRAEAQNAVAVLEYFRSLN